MSSETGQISQCGCREGMGQLSQGLHGEQKRNWQLPTSDVFHLCTEVVSASYRGQLQWRWRNCQPKLFYGERLRRASLKRRCEILRFPRGSIARSLKQKCLRANQANTQAFLEHQVVFDDAIIKTKKEFSNDVTECTVYMFRAMTL